MTEQKATYPVQPPQKFLLLKWRAKVLEFAKRQVDDEYGAFCKEALVRDLDDTADLAEVMEAILSLQTSVNELHRRVGNLEGLFDRWSKALQTDVMSQDKCPVCKGEGQIELPPGETGRVTKINCCECRGSGRLPPVDVRSLEERVKRLATRIGAMEQQSESKASKEEER